MALTPGDRFGPYEIVSSLGEGGMGAVYRARDTRLNREVAIKVLPDRFADDADRVARFEREAQLLAAINHPNIGAIYGLEQSGTSRLLVLELIDGESLAGRIARAHAGKGGGSPFPIAEVLSIARQIVGALESAHDKGIVHRDLKPANIMLSADGQVKVLDFGLARLEPSEAGGAGELTHSPTLSFAATQAGVILGTAAYMSPEQAKGRIADKRSDVWAFGCVLFEMLTGRRAFEGEDLSDTLATVLKTDPRWNELAADVPDSVRIVLKGCLEKDRKARIPDMSVVRYILDGTLAATAQAKVPTDAARATVRRLRLWQAAAAVFLLVASIGIPFMYAWRSATRAVARFFVFAPEKSTFVTQGRTATTVAISPDGTRLAFTARDSTGKTALWIRPLDSLVAQPLAGTEGASFPFWSPDSRFVAYFATGRLSKIEVTGGPPQTICTCSGVGGTWSRDGAIVFNNGQGPLVRVASAGGAPAPLTKLAAGQSAHVFPSFLPDGRHVLFFAVSFAVEFSGIHVAAIEDGESKRLVLADTSAVFSPRGGYLLFAREGTLLAQSFDVKTLATSGEPFPVAERAESAAFAGITAFSVSDTGVLAYGIGSGAGFGLQMTWIDREGKPTETVGSVGNYRGIDLSRDGRRLAAHRHDGAGGDIWVTELSRGSTSRFTFDSGQENSSPIWSPDGTHIAFAALRKGKWGLYRKASNGTGSEELLLESAIQILPTSWSSDGQSLVYRVDSNAGDQWMLPLSGDRKPVALLDSLFNESHAQVSPDGRWLAYHSFESNRAEIYVRPFPSGPGKWQVSLDGGIFARWRADGRELFYLSATNNGKMMAVDVKGSGATFESGTPRALFDSGYINLGHTGIYHTYAVSPNGQRFLIPRPPSSMSAENASPPIAVVLNWTAGIK